ncbi:MAG: ABC transporter substrate-binding protein [Desulfovibrionaceae bacterium]|nr:ABC transporter substrate-binding protein [Desulfovibrionaceae bacterium]
MILKRLWAAALAVAMTAGPAWAAEGGVLNISYVKAPFNLQSIVMKRLGLLEKELEPLGVTVEWHEITSGAQQAQAMAAGSLDVAGVMNTTSIQMARGEGNPIKIVAAVSRPVGVFAIVGAKDGVTDIPGLKGKIVAGPKGTVLHQILVAALAREGMSIHDVQFIQMDIPKAFAALESGRADAALLAANMVVNALSAGGTVIASAEGLAVPKLAVAASESFIDQYPDRLAAVLRAHDKAAAWIAEHHDEAIAMGAEEQGVDIPAAEKLFGWSHFTQRFNQADLDSMNDDLAFMLDNGMMRNRVDPRDIVTPGAME